MSNVIGTDTTPKSFPSVKSTDRPKIALFLSYLGGGGAERVNLNLAQGAIDRGFAVDLVLGKAWGPHLPKVPPNVRVVDLNAGRTLAMLPALVNYLKRERPAALLSAMHYANEIAILAKFLAGGSTRILVSEHNTVSKSFPNLRGAKRFAIPFAVRYLYPLADEVVTVSRGAADALAKASGLDRVRVVYNPVITPEMRDLAREPLEHPWFQPGEPPVFLGVGKLETQKDFPNLIRAFAKVRQQKPCRLGILGWGPDRSQLETLISELDLARDAALLGYADNPYVYMSRSISFVLSSAWEGLPTVLIEALALGIPVISTDCPSGPSEILNSGQYGTLVPVGDSDALAKAMLDVLDGNRKSAPSQWLDRFTNDSAVEAYLQLMKLSPTPKPLQ
ncbi:MAG: glycosyltransferase [Cyanobacteria bacterium SID2]|nr:glycosyltransferase [Cyanobacteria bacterium SID2]MBP0002619.1 glycosyltransferase [Cyanobacteria bacterium SBC]